jgi:hypothetical protein
VSLQLLQALPLHLSRRCLWRIEHQLNLSRIQLQLLPQIMGKLIALPTVLEQQHSSAWTDLGSHKDLFSDHVAVSAALRANNVIGYFLDPSWTHTYLIDSYRPYLLMIASPRC